MATIEHQLTTLKRPWNKGVLVGQKRPLLPKHVWSIRVRLEMSGSLRDLALFNLGIDSKLRACDLVRLRMEFALDLLYCDLIRPVAPRVSPRPRSLRISDGRWRSAGLVGPGYRVRQVVGQARRLRSASRPRLPRSTCRRISPMSSAAALSSVARVASGEDEWSARQ
jgi:hypothetical protein